MNTHASENVVYSIDNKQIRRHMKLPFFLKLKKRETGEYIVESLPKPVANPSALFVEQLQTKRELEQAVNRAIELAEREKKRDRELYIILKIQLATACRISEILKIEGKDILNKNSVIIRASKGGRDIIIFVEGIEKELESCKQRGGKLIQVWNYYSIRRKYASEGIAVRLNGRKNYAITHVFRYALAEDARELKEHQEALATTLKHRSIKTQKYYKK